MSSAGFGFDLSLLVCVVGGTSGVESDSELSSLFLAGSSIVFAGLGSSISSWFRSVPVSGCSVSGVGVGFLENLS